MTTTELVSHRVDDFVIHQRKPDGYFDATAMCRAVGRLFADYRRLDATQEFLDELASDMGIPISKLVLSIRGGSFELRGTWIHPDVAIHLAQWCSPKFAVAVSRWVREWFGFKVADLTPWLCFNPRPWEKRFPAEFYIQVLRLKRRELDSDKRTERWWGHVTNDLIYFRLGEGVAEGLQKANPVREDRDYRGNKHHQHFAPGAPDRRLTSLIGEAIGVMKMCPSWDEFHAQWDSLHPRFDDLQPQFAFMYSDVRLFQPCKITK